MPLCFRNTHSRKVSLLGDVGIQCCYLSDKKGVQTKKLVATSLMFWVTRLH